jgi:restriction endonuclease S subunit
MIELPDGWELKRLGDCLENLKSGKKAERGWSPQCLSHPSRGENIWGVLKTTSVQMGEFQPEYNKELPESLEPKVGLEVNPGDFLVTTTGPRNRCGIVCHVKKTRKKLIFSGKILRFRVNEDEILPNWLMFLLMSPRYQGTLDKMKVGTSDSSVSIGNQQILDLQVPVPPIGEQLKIVNLLEDHLSRLESSLKDIKQTKKDFVKFKKSLLQDIFSNTSQLWEMKKLEELAEVIDPHPSHRAPKIDLNGIPFIGISDVQEDGNAEFKKARLVSPKIFEEHAKRYSLHDELIALGRVASVGKVVKLPNGDRPYTISPTLAVIRAVGIDKEFLYYALQSPQIQNQLNRLKQGSGRQSVGIMKLRKIQIPLIPLKTQKEIVNYIELQFSLLKPSVQISDELVKSISILRRSLLQAAFTGQLTNGVASV